MNKVKKIIITCVSILTIFSLSLSIYKVKADSGFDSSYDSGSWDSDSWSSDSSWDDDYSWDDDDTSTTSGSSGTHATELMFIIFVVFIIIYIIAYVNNMNVNSKHNYSGNKFNNSLAPGKIYTDEELVKMTGMNNADLKAKLFETYLNIQNSWMNFDYETLKTLVTDELYNQYNMQLKTLSTKGEQNIMEDITLKDIAFEEIYQANNITTVNCKMIITMKDYIVKGTKVVRGDKIPTTITYKMTFMVRNISESKCPACGAEIGPDDKKCPYCRSEITKLSSNIVMSKKQNIQQTKGY